MRLADYVVRWLEQHVDTVFVVSGGGSIFLCDALAKAEKMRYVAMHHEQACAIAAEAYARVRGTIGVAIVTSGPGGTNAITGVAGAWLDHVPVLIISGQAFLKHTINEHPGLRQLGVQEINIVDVVKPITKWATSVENKEEILMELDGAYQCAVHGRPGPSWLDLPGDIQNAEIDPDALTGLMDTPDGKSSIASEVGAVVDRLLFAQRPLIHVGQGVRIAGAIKKFLTLVEYFGIPFVTARNANDIAPWDHPLLVGRPGTFAQRGANFAVQTCDLYIAIGTRLALTQTGYNSHDYARNAQIIVVDIDKAELTKPTVRASLRIQADAKDFLIELNKQLGHIMKKDRFLEPWVTRCQSWKKRYPAVLPEWRDL